jgi:hypothetical protein
MKRSYFHALSVSNWRQNLSQSWMWVLNTTATPSNGDGVFIEASTVNLGF